MRIRSITGLVTLALALAACGGGVSSNEPNDTLAAPQTDSSSTTDSTGRLESIASESSTTGVPEVDDEPADEPAQSTQPGAEPRTSTTSPVRAEAVPSTTVPPPMLGEVPDHLMQAVVADAESRTRVDPSAMTIIRSEAVVWNDGSLGCPVPGVMYTQEIIEGYWVELSAGEAMLDYRLNSNGAFVLCENDGPRP